MAVLAHELRAPAQVISGYARMLAEGRLDDGQRQRALTQLESAAGRIGLISRQAAEVAHWESRPGGIPHGVPLGDLVTSATGRSGLPGRISACLGGDDQALRVRAIDDLALAAALATIIDSVGREVTDDTILIVSRASRSVDSCDLLIGAGTLLRPPHHTGEADGPLSLQQGGLGLALVLGAAVLDAHGASVWHVRGQTGIVGVSLRLESSRPTP